MGSKHNELFLRKEEESASEELDEKWDDYHLIKAYNKAVAKAKREILKKIQKEDNLTNEEIQGIISEEISEPEHSKPKNKKKSKLSISKNSDWKIGDFCRSIYSEDGGEYEAQIVGKIDGNFCVVKFLGYNNEEEVYLNELMPSMGKSFRKMQKEMAENDLKKQLGQPDSEEVNSVEEGEVETMSEDESDLEPMRFPNLAGLDSTRSFHLPPPPLGSPRPYHLPPPPPVPPMLPSALNGFHPMSRPPFPLPRSTDKNMDSLLLSWYMCGYYTGYYANGMKN